MLSLPKVVAALKPWLVLGIPKISIYGNDILWSQAPAVINTWYVISDADIETGYGLGITHDGSGKITVPVNGKYMFIYSVSASINQDNKHIQIALEYSSSPGVPDEAGRAFNTLYSGYYAVFSGQAIVTLAAGREIRLMIMCGTAGAPTISVHSVNLVAMRVEI